MRALVSTCYDHHIQTAQLGWTHTNCPAGGRYLKLTWEPDHVDNRLVASLKA